MATTAENEDMYTKREVVLAKEAQEFIKNAAYPSQREAAQLASDGNIHGVPITSRDVNRAFTIYGPPAEAVRGKSTQHKAQREEADDSEKEQRTDQILYSDVMKVKEQSYLITLAEPLFLLIQTRVARETTECLGEALESQMQILRSKGFRPVRVYVEPQRALTALSGKFPGVEIDVSGAGDHLDKLDIRIRRIKETIRSVNAGLPWKRPDAQVKDIVAYAVSRINVRKTRIMGPDQNAESCWETGVR